MKKLSSINEIRLPHIHVEQPYESTLHDKKFSFKNLKYVLGAADISKAGDRNAKLAATDETMREAARAILSGLTLQQIFNTPLTNSKGKIDSVMQVNYDINQEVFSTISHLTLGELKDHLLRETGSQMAQIGTALTGVMVAAVTKLLDTHELIFLAKKLKGITTTKARTTLGISGTLSSRLQPNHPTDDLDAMSFLVYTGLSMGSGDAIFGLNPAIDTVANINSCLQHLDKLRRETGAPTQICVLSHIKTQLACLAEGAPVEVLFQSLAGTESTLTDEFDVTVELLDSAYATMQMHGALKDIAENFMYFETGQGSEYSYNKHDDIDMTTTEALCYGLARRYSPLMVNNVTGFIGPETHLDNHEMIYSNLQDHFMGKLMGLPMGMAPCYTLHSQVSIEGQQMATQLLTAAGANFFMDVYLGADRMLAYFDTSGHDDQTLREIHGLSPTPEYLAWALALGIFEQDAAGKVSRGRQWGNPSIFCKSPATLQRLQASVPGYYGNNNAGPRPNNATSRAIKANQAIGREAIYANLRPDEIFNGEMSSMAFRTINTEATSKHEHLNNPALGARLGQVALHDLVAEYNDVQIVISDGLSAEAVHHNIPELLPVLLDGLNSRQLKMGLPILAPLGRVKLAESISDVLQSQLTILLIGERPGGDALASRSLSAYFAFKLNDAKTQSAAAQFSGNADIHYEYSVISNIYAGGLLPIEAGSVIAEKAFDILKYQAAGNRLESLI